MIGIKYLNEAYAVQTEDSGIESSNYVHTQCGQNYSGVK